MSKPQPRAIAPSVPPLPLAGSIRADMAHPLGGRIVMAGFPGLESAADGTAVFLPDPCAETLEGLRALGAARLFVLVERAELDAAAFDLLEAEAARVGVALVFHPIADYGVPSDALTAAWAAQAAARMDLLRSGGTLAFACQYGAGRSGLMACWALIEGGMTAAEAMAFVRAHFPDAVESAAQEAWLASVSVA